MSRQAARAATSSSHTWAPAGSTGRSPSHQVSQSGWLAGEAVGELAGAVLDRGGDDDGLVGVDAVVGELVVPAGDVFGDGLLGEGEVVGGVGGEVGGVGMVDRFDLPPGKHLVAWRPSGADEVDVGGAGVVGDGGDGADVVPVQGPHPAADVQEPAVSAGRGEPFAVRRSGCGARRLRAVRTTPVTWRWRACELVEGGGGGEVGDAGEVGGDRGGEQFGVGVFEGVEQVGSGVVVGFGRQPDPGGCGGRSPIAAASWLVAYSQAPWRARDRAT